MNTQYISKQQLRSLGFTQLDSVIMPWLDRLDQIVADGVSHEILLELKQNHSTDKQQAYAKLRQQNDFDSPIIQSWLKHNVPALAEITTDNIEFVLHDIRTSKLTPNAE